MTYKSFQKDEKLITSFTDIKENMGILKEREGKERQGKEMEGKQREEKGREGKEREGKERKRKGREGKERTEYVFFLAPPYMLGSMVVHVRMAFHSKVFITY